MPDTVNDHVMIQTCNICTDSCSLPLSVMDEDISRLKTTAVGLLNDLGCNGVTLTEDLINEMCRFGAAELHAVAAFIGGIASQEVIKVFVFLALLHLIAVIFTTRDPNDGHH